MKSPRKKNLPEKHCPCSKKQRILIFLIPLVFIILSEAFCQQKCRTANEGLSAAAAGDFTGAREIFNAALECNVKDDTSRSSLELINDFDKNRINKECAVYLFRSLDYFYKGMHQDAITGLSASIKSCPDYPRGYNILGMFYAVSDRKDLAEESFRKAIDIDSNYAKAYYNLACLYQVQDRVDDAVKYFQRAAYLSRDLGGASYSGIASIYASSGKIKEALGYYNKALECEPDNPIIQYQSGLLYLMEDDYANARNRLEKAAVLYEFNNDQAGLARTQAYLIKIDEINSLGKQSNQ